MFIYLPNSQFRCCSYLFVGFRTEIVFVSKTKVYVLELTVMRQISSRKISSRNYKLNTYKDLQKARAELIKNYDLCVMTCELSVLGFLNMVCKVLNVPGTVNCDFSLCAELTETVIYDSFNIYIRRNNYWRA